MEKYLNKITLIPSEKTSLLIEHLIRRL